MGFPVICISHEKMQQNPLIREETGISITVLLPIHQMTGTSNHRTIIRTGITCKKIPYYMRDSACRWFIVKKAKIFYSYVKHF